MKIKFQIKIIFPVLFCLGIFLCKTGYSQVTIISKSINSFWATPESLMKVGLLNAGAQQRVILQGRLFNSTGDLLLKVLSFPFDLPHGATRDLPMQINTVEFSSVNQAEYIRVNHILPSGKYNICYSILAELEENSLSDNCDEIVSDFNSNLYLVSPFDEEVIETRYPLLVWHHTEPFDVLNSGEFFRIVVVERQKEQSAGAAITTNIPVFIKDFLLSHQVPYSIDAVALEQGKQYAWEVQKISQNAIIQKTETWSFSIRNKEEEKDFKYVSLAKTIDAGFYTAVNRKIFFRFDEEYNNEKIKCTVLDSKNSLVNASPENEKNITGETNSINHGYNRFELDLNTYHLTKGFYVLQVVNQKNEVYKLKFYIE